MEVRILTLFDDEPIVPQPAARKKRTATPKQTAATETPAEPQPLAGPADIPEAPPATDAQAVAPKKTAGRPPKTTGSTDISPGKNYYTIGETAALFQVRISHIRFWTVQFALKVRTTRKGDRLYTPENINQLKLIHQLVKEQGYTIAGAKTRMKELRHSPPEARPQGDLRSSLLLLKEQLIDLRKYL